MNRRQTLFGLTAAASGAAGLLAWCAQAGQANPKAAASAASAAVPGRPVAGEIPAHFWQLSLTQPQGGNLRLADFQAQPLLVNFWATWCPPCVKEMPLLDTFSKSHSARGVRVVGLAVDGPTPVREFLARQPVSFPIGLAGLEGPDLLRSLGNPGGQLPFTLWIPGSGRPVTRHRGVLDAAMLSQWARQLT
jgi:thiol-disulfide isomerase/thioredoxin